LLGKTILEINPGAMVMTPEGEVPVKPNKSYSIKVADDAPVNHYKELRKIFLANTAKTRKLALRRYVEDALEITKSPVQIDYSKFKL
jgi:hypothetical protein